MTLNQSRRPNELCWSALKDEFPLITSSTKSTSIGAWFPCKASDEVLGVRGSPKNGLGLLGERVWGNPSSWGPRDEVECYRRDEVQSYTVEESCERRLWNFRLTKTSCTYLPVGLRA